MPTIGFIAMSGVRCNDTELLELGLNLPGFVERSEVIASLPSLGLLTLAGQVPEDFQKEYLEVPDVTQFKASEHPFDIVAISSFSAKIKDAYELAQEYQKLGTHVVLGGLHVTSLPEEAAQYADTLILGEAESDWPVFLQDFLEGKPKAIYDGRESNFDMAQAPMPAFELLDIQQYNRITIQTQRGCPWKCNFCASSIKLTPSYKQKPVQKVIEELHKVKSIWAQPFIEFADDNTFVNKAYGKELARALIPENIRWFTETDISVGEDNELLELLAQSGCAQLLIGLESPFQDSLGTIDSLGNWKQKQGDRYLELIHNIQSHGITVNGCFILGLDETHTDYFDKLFEFIKKSHLFEIQITVLTPFPGTPLYQDLLEQGRILEPNAWERSTLFDINFQPQNMSVEELRQGLISLGSKVYDKGFIKERRKHFFTLKKELS